MSILSTITLIVLTFTLLGLMLGIAASFDTQRAETAPSTENIDRQDPEIQQKLFEDCIKDQRFDGELTDDEYSRCAHGIYG